MLKDFGLEIKLFKRIPFDILVALSVKLFVDLKRVHKHKLVCRELLF